MLRPSFVNGASALASSGLVYAFHRRWKPGSARPKQFHAVKDRQMREFAGDRFLRLPLSEMLPSSYYSGHLRQ